MACASLVTLPHFISALHIVAPSAAPASAAQFRVRRRQLVASQGVHRFLALMGLDFRPCELMTMMTTPSERERVSTHMMTAALRRVQVLKFRGCASGPQWPLVIKQNASHVVPHHSGQSSRRKEDPRSASKKKRKKQFTSSNLLNSWQTEAWHRFCG